MTAYIGAIVAGIIFLLVVRLVGLLRRPDAVYRVTKQALRDLRSSALDDDAKEAHMRRHSMVLGRLFLEIAGGAGLALGVPLALLWLLDRAGIVSLSRVLAALASWQFLVGTAAAIGAKLVFNRMMRLGP